jgi:hypothetical protein
MNRPDGEFGEKVARLLDRGVDTIDASAQQRLAAARALALSRYRERPAPVWSLAWATSAVFRGREHRLLNARYVIAAGALAVALAGVMYWQTLMQGNDVAELEVSLLTDELPINAYLDKGFDAWLKRAPR